MKQTRIAAPLRLIMKAMCVQLALICCCVAFQPLLAQNTTKQIIKGKVVDEKGLPVSGADVEEKGNTANSTQTATDGTFSINVPQKAVLVISSIGFASTELTAQNGMIVTFNIKEKKLDDVVVVGYQQLAKRKVTGAIASIRAKDFEGMPLASVDQMLQGKAAGVSISVFTGQPGGNSAMLVRGNTKMMSDYDGDLAFSSPLYVIDGIQVSDNEVKHYTDLGMSFLSSINPGDIESVDILKDASAAAIYGSRGGNGVILIKTKRGGGKPVFTVNASSGFTMRPKLTETMMGAEERRMKMELINHYGNYKIFKESLPIALTDSLNPAFNNANDWQKMYFKPGKISNCDVSFTGGDAKTNYRISGGYYDEKGIIIGTGFNRISFAANLNTTITEKLKFRTSLRISRTDIKTGRSAGRNEPRGTFSMNPIDMPASYYYMSAEDRASYLDPYSHVRNDNINRELNGFIEAEYNILKPLTFLSSLSYSTGDGRVDYARPSYLSDYGTAYSFSNVTEADRASMNNRLVFLKDFGKHSLNVMAGQEYESRKNLETGTDGRNVPNDNIQVINGVPQEYKNGWSNIITGAQLSYLGSVRYGYDDRYLFDVLGRADASSRFGAANKWGRFYSLSAAWRMSAEKFMQNISWLDELKWRLSYGVLGDQGSIGENDRYNAYQVTSSYQGVTGVIPGFGTITKDNISWESAKSWNFGFTLSALKSRVNLEADYYQRETSGQMFRVWVPETSGYSNTFSNAAGVVNRGVEFQLTTRNLAPKSKVQWTTNLNISYNKNFVSSLPNGGRDLDVGSSRYVMGMPINLIKGYIVNGVINSKEDMMVNPATGGVGQTKWGDLILGDPNWVDITGDYKISDELGEDDRAIIGDPNIKLYGGISNTVTWNNFSASVYCNFVGNRDIVNNSFARKMENSFFYSDPSALAHASIFDLSKLNAWRQPGDNASYPALFAFNHSVYAWRTGQSSFIENGAFFRIQNVSLGYNFAPAKYSFMKKAGLQGLRLYGVVYNVALFQSFSGPDAERVNSQGYDFGDGYPVPKKFTFGLEVKF